MRPTEALATWVLRPLCMYNHLFFFYLFSSLLPTTLFHHLWTNWSPASSEPEEAVQSWNNQSQQAEREASVNQMVHRSYTRSFDIAFFYFFLTCNLMEHSIFFFSAKSFTFLPWTPPKHEIAPKLGSRMFLFKRQFLQGNKTAKWGSCSVYRVSDGLLLWVNVTAAF